MDAHLSNPDLMPTSVQARTWAWYHFAALWIGMVMCITAYMLSGSLIMNGMSWKQAVATIFLGNVIVLIPMLLIGHAGVKYGIPCAVLMRSSFGTLGAKLPAFLRALVACGWYGIDTWIGGQMIYTLGSLILGVPIGGAILPFLGINFAQLVCFMAFWFLQLWFIVHGIDSIRKLETYTAPIKIVICFVLLGWVYHQAGGLGPILDQPSQFEAGGAKAGQFWQVFWPSLTAMVGFWAALALSIADFTRFTKNQREQVIGQMVGLPIPMAMLSLLAVLVTSATIVIYGEALWDPITLAGRMTGIAVLVALIVLLVDTISVNLAANMVGPSYDFSALYPQKISYKVGGYITAALAILMMPWKVIETTDGYIFTWLIGYSSLLGPITGILIVDYFLIRRTKLNVEALYQLKGIYHYGNGWNKIALLAFILGVLPNIPGFLGAAFPASFTNIPSIFNNIYTYAWFVGLLISSTIYWVGMYRIRS
ncbi:MAG: NCS1 family nucleobase:cation symporter-1 [Neisseriales bacterium]|nr:MAG: NCS1 family nucleobase:cation symporter-1 [Neisseriales bacterium]